MVRVYGEDGGGTGAAGVTVDVEGGVVLDYVARTEGFLGFRSFLFGNTHFTDKILFQQRS